MALASTAKAFQSSPVNSESADIRLIRIVLVRLKILARVGVEPKTYDRANHAAHSKLEPSRRPLKLKESLRPLGFSMTLVLVLVHWMAK